MESREESFFLVTWSTCRRSGHAWYASRSISRDTDGLDPEKGRKAKGLTLHALQLAPHLSLHPLLVLLHCLQLLHDSREGVLLALLFSGGNVNVDRRTSRGVLGWDLDVARAGVPVPLGLFGRILDLDAALSIDFPSVDDATDEEKASHEDEQRHGVDGAQGQVLTLLFASAREGAAPPGAQALEHAAVVAGNHACLAQPRDVLADEPLVPDGHHETQRILIIVRNKTTRELHHLRQKNQTTDNSHIILTGMLVGMLNRLSSTMIFEALWVGKAQKEI